MILIGICDTNLDKNDDLHKKLVTLSHEIVEAHWRFETVHGRIQLYTYLEQHFVEAVILLGVTESNLEVVKEIRECTESPIIAIMDIAEDGLKLNAMEMGADICLDCYTKNELILAYLKNLFLRTMPPEQIIFGTLRISLAEHVVTLDYQPLELPCKVFYLLCYLALNPNQVLTREQILSHVWDLSYDGDPRTVDTHIKVLRKQLGDYGRHIVTVRGVGYQFKWRQAGILKTKRKPKYLPPKMPTNGNFLLAR